MKFQITILRNIERQAVVFSEQVNCIKSITRKKYIHLNTSFVSSIFT